MVTVAALRVVGGVRVLLGRHALCPGAVDLPASGIAARASSVGRLVVLVLEAGVAVVFVGLNGLLPPGWQLGCVHAGGLSPKGGMMEWEGRDGMRSGFGCFSLGTGGCGPESGSNGKRWRLDSAQEKVETQSQVQGLSLPSGAVAAVWAGQGSACFAAWATGSEWEVSKRRWSDGCREMEPIPGDLGPRALSLRFTGVLAGPLQPSNDGWSRTECHKWAPGTSRRGPGNLA
jgi:hypothetical protein